MPVWLLVSASLNLYIIDASDTLKGCEQLSHEYSKLNSEILLICIHKKDHNMMVKKVLKETTRTIAEKERIRKCLKK
jgi:hypothetical protein|tara:strand:+ start:1433 stop:1663 length:231 start_codon:yes stop_codon:yes gene_type:complete